MATDQVTPQTTYSYGKRRGDQGTLSNRIKNLTNRNTLAGQYQAFLLYCEFEGLSWQTVAGYRRKLSLFIRFSAESNITSPSDVIAEHIKIFLAQKRHNCNSTTINSHYRTLHRFFEWLVEEHVIKCSPMANIKPPKKARTIIRPFTQTQIATMLSLCDDSNIVGARNKAMIMMFYDTGLRLSEMVSLQIDNIDFDHGVIRIMGKGLKERMVGVSRITLRAIIHYLLKRADSLPYLWLAESGKPLLAWGVIEMVRRLGKRAGITGVRCSPHTFRHSFGTQALRNGASPYEVQSLLGHSTLDMTRRYTATISSEDAVVSHKRFSPVENMNMREI